MKSLLLLLAISLPSSLAMAHDIDPAESTYSCRLFEPDPTGGKVTELHIGKNDVVNHTLLDGNHRVSLQWYDWTLNISVFAAGTVPEVVGGASHLFIKLRSHDPDVSIYCSNDALD